MENHTALAFYAVHPNYLAIPCWVAPDDLSNTYTDDTKYADFLKSVEEEQISRNRSATKTQVPGEEEAKATSTGGTETSDLVSPVVKAAIERRLEREIAKTNKRKQQSEGSRSAGKRGLTARNVPSPVSSAPVARTEDTRRKNSDRKLGRAAVTEGGA